jgi:hypothetical protein
MYVGIVLNTKMFCMIQTVIDYVYKTYMFYLVGVCEGKRRRTKQISSSVSRLGEETWGWFIDTDSCVETTMPPKRRGPTLSSSFKIKLNKKSYTNLYQMDKQQPISSHRSSVCDGDNSMHHTRLFQKATR